MASIVRGVFRCCSSTSIAVRHHYIHNASNQARDINLERWLRDWRLMVVKDVSAKVKRITIEQDTKSNPFRGFYNSLGVPSYAFKPPGFWRLNLGLIYLFSFTVGIETGQKDAKMVIEECQKEIKTVKNSQRNY